MGMNQSFLRALKPVLSIYSSGIKSFIAEKEKDIVAYSEQMNEEKGAPVAFMLTVIGEKVYAIPVKMIDTDTGQTFIEQTTINISGEEKKAIAVSDLITNALNNL